MSNKIVLKLPQSDDKLLENQQEEKEKSATCSLDFLFTKLQDTESKKKDVIIKSREPSQPWKVEFTINYL